MSLLLYVVSATLQSVDVHMRNLGFAFAWSLCMKALGRSLYLQKIIFV